MVPNPRQPAAPTPSADSRATEHHCPGLDGRGTLPVLAGRYRVDRLLAQGGMGEVYQILDHDFDRPLALKVLQPQFAGKAEVAERFLREARLTGQLQHPGIPPVQEVGRLADGRPYFLMKLVQGRDLHALLQERASPQEQLGYYLGVFEQVCRTVAYAHAQGIIHRDLKPGNVMVGAFGEVQVMDWGLAKPLPAAPPVPAAAAPETLSTVVHPPAALPELASVAGEVIGTPAYMAPEQARGEVEQLDRTCDVFGLGAILCELLTGQAPFAGGSRLDKQRRAMRGDLTEAFAGLDGCGADRELVALARRCLAPERAERFADADGVAQAVAAYQEVVRQRLRQAEVSQAEAQVRIDEERKRLALARQKWQLTLVLGGAVVLALVVGMTVALAALGRAWEAEQAEAEKTVAAVQARAAEEQAKTNAQRLAAKEREARLATDREKQLADKHLARLTKAQKILEGIFVAVNPRLADKDSPPLLAQLATNMDMALQLLEEESVGERLPVARLQLWLANAQAKLGHRKQAIVLYLKARATFEELQGPNHPLTLALLNNLGVVYVEDGQLETGLALLEATLKKRQVWLGPGDPETLQTKLNVANAYRDAGRVKKAVPLLEEVLAKDLVNPGPDDPKTLTAMNNLALAYLDEGQGQKALPLLIETLAKRKQVLGADHFDTLTSMNNLGLAYQDEGQVARALPLFEEAAEQFKVRFGADHPETLTVTSNLAVAYRETGQVQKAIALLENLLAKRKEKLGADHPATLGNMVNLSSAYREAGRLEDALRLAREALERLQARLGADHPAALNAMHGLALVYQAAGQLHRAIPLYVEVLDKRRAKLGAEHPDTLTTLHNLGLCYFLDGQLRQGLPLLEETVEKRQARLGPDHPLTLASMNTLASAYRRDGQLQKALPLLEQTLAKRKEVLGADHHDTVTTMNDLGAAYWSAGRLDKSVPLFEQTLRLRQAKLGPYHVESLNTQANLGVNYRDAGRLKEAIAQMEAALDGGRKLPAGLQYRLAWVKPELALAYENDGQFARAEPLYRSALDHAQRQFPAGDLRLGNPLVELGWNLLQQKKYAEAEPLLRDCLALRQKHQPLAWTTYYTQACLGSALLGQKKYAAAEPQLLEGYRGLEQSEPQHPKGGRPRLRETLDRLIELYAAWGKQEEAARWRAVRDGTMPPVPGNGPAGATRRLRLAADSAGAGPLVGLLRGIKPEVCLVGLLGRGGDSTVTELVGEFLNRFPGQALPLMRAGHTRRPVDTAPSSIAFP
jgi:serine/threonine protein kinase